MGKNRHSSFTKPKSSSKKEKPRVTPKTELLSTSKINQPVLPQEDPKSELSEQPETTWTKFWHIFKPKIKRFAGLGLLGGAFTMIQINEFAIAGVLLSLSLITFTIQIFEWQGITGNSNLTKGLKLLSFVCVLGVVIFFSGVIYFSKGDKPWSTWQHKELQPTYSKNERKPMTDTQSPITNLDTKQIPDEKPLPTESKKPTFSEGIGAVMFTVGNNKQTGESVNLQKGRHNFFIGDVPATLYLENNKPFIDVDLYTPPDEPPIRLRHNVLESKPSQWDMNSDDNGIEVVDEKKRPIFQLNYKSPSHIVMYGVFFNGYDNWLASPEGFRSTPDLDKKPYPIKRLFKYPSSQYKGKRIK